MSARLTRAELEAAIRECIAKGLLEPGSTPEKLKVKTSKAGVVR